MESTDWSAMNPNRLAIHILDDGAKANPDRSYAVLPVSSTSFNDGVREITYAQVASAANGVAHWLVEHFGKGSDFETLTYFGGNDFMHVVLVFGAVKAGYKLFLTSPREVPQLQAQMLENANCTKILMSDEIPAVKQIAEKLANSHVLTIPKVDWFLTQTFKHFPYNKTYEQAMDEPFLSLTTSGTTGLPKPIVWTNRYMSAYAIQRWLEPPAGYESTDRLMMGNRLFSTGLPFHASGMWAGICLTLFCGTTVMYPPPAAIVNAKLAVEGIIVAKADWAIVLSPYMEQLASDPPLLERLAQHAPDVVLFWGGNGVSQKAGDMISQRIRTVDMCGSTETGMWPGIRVQGPWDPRTWSSLHPHPAAGLQFRSMTENEHLGVFVKNQDPSFPQPVFCVFPDAKEMSTGDLWQRFNLGDEVRWASVGRADDLQVLHGAEKFNSLSVEQDILKVCQNSILDQVLVACHDLPFTIVLLETKDNAGSTPASNVNVQQEHEKFLDEFWSSIEALNASIPHFAALDRRRVIFTTAEKPMSRTSKGTIRRKLTMANYKPEFDAIVRGFRKAA